MAAAVPTHGRVLDFAGLSWTVHAADEPTGAGPNRWSDEEEAARVVEGVLHLQLTRDERGWQGVELSTPLVRRPRRLLVELEVGELDSRVVAGVFLYRSDTSEIDLEVARWGDASALPFQYAVAPADAPDLLHRFGLPAGRSRHRLRWRRDRILWRSRSGKRRVRWRLRGEQVPRFDGHRLHLNLWVLHGGTPAGDGDGSVRIGIIRVHPRGRPHGGHPDHR